MIPLTAPCNIRAYAQAANAETPVPPGKLIKEFEVSAEHIAAKAVELMGVKRSHRGDTVL